MLSLWLYSFTLRRTYSLQILIQYMISVRKQEQNLFGISLDILLLTFLHMKVITCPVATAPVISVRTPAEAKHFEWIDNALNHLVSTRDLEVFSEMTHLPAKESTDMRTWEVKDLPEVVSYQIKRGFLNITSAWSIFHKNNNVKTSLWYLNEDGLPILTNKGGQYLLSVTA